MSTLKTTYPYYPLFLLSCRLGSDSDLNKYSTGIFRRSFKLSTLLIRKKFLNILDNPESNEGGNESDEGAMDVDSTENERDSSQSGSQTEQKSTGKQNIHKNIMKEVELTGTIVNANPDDVIIASSASGKSINAFLF